jgi:hypothetical protein
MIVLVGVPVVGLVVVLIKVVEASLEARRVVAEVLVVALISQSCSQQCVPTVATAVKFRLNQTVANQCCVATVLLRRMALNHASAMTVAEIAQNAHLALRLQLP